jgi:class 3 adenylate cyclase
VKNTGDGFLAEFPSAVEAVRAALRFQSRIHEFAAADPEHGRVAFRIGVNIGDIIVEPHDIFGDGVNIAARLEGISASGGICISLSIHDQIQGKVDVDVVDPWRASAQEHFSSGSGLCGRHWWLVQHDGDIA